MKKFENRIKLKLKTYEIKKIKSKLYIKRVFAENHTSQKTNEEK